MGAAGVEHLSLLRQDIEIEPEPEQESASLLASKVASGDIVHPEDDWSNPAFCTTLPALGSRHWQAWLSEQTAPWPNDEGQSLAVRHWTQLPE